MTFRQHTFLYYETLIYCSTMLVLCLALIPVIGTGFALLVALPFAAVLIVNPRLYDSWIIMDESGITCRKGDKTIWSHEWHNIATLKRSNRFRFPSVEVILYDAKGQQAPFALPDHYFQLSKKAKQAIEQYYKGRTPDNKEGA